METTGNQGILKVYGLNEWWDKTFTEREKLELSRSYTRLYDTSYLGIDELDENILTESQVEVFSLSDDLRKVNFNKKSYFIQQTSVLSFLSEMVGCAYRSNGIPTIEKISKKAEYFIENTNQPILDCHFFYGSLIGIYFQNRKAKPKYFEKVIHYCKKQIAISPKAAKEFARNDPNGQIPTHVGYIRLAIILEKEEQYELAIDYCKIAQNQGWNGDWSQRINRCSLKLMKK